MTIYGVISGGNLCVEVARLTLAQVIMMHTKKRNNNTSIDMLFYCNAGT